jgi:hypothetical protein
LVQLIARVQNFTTEDARIMMIDPSELGVFANTKGGDHGMEKANL